MSPIYEICLRWFGYFQKYVFEEFFWEDRMKNLTYWIFSMCKIQTVNLVYFRNIRKFQFLHDGNLRSEGDARDARPPLGPISFIFMPFSEKNWPNNRFLSTLLGLEHPIWEILDPRLTDHLSNSICMSCANMAIF